MSTGQQAFAPGEEPPEGRELDACARARLAAEKVMRESCDDENLDLVAVDDHTTVFAPAEDRDLLDDLSDSPISEANFTEFLERSKVLAEWLGGMCGSAGAEDTDDLRRCIQNLGSKYLDEEIEGVSTDAVELVASHL